MATRMNRVERLETRFAARRALTHEAIIRAVNAILPRWQDRMGPLIGDDADAEPDPEHKREIDRRIWDELRRRGYDVPAAAECGEHDNATDKAV
ncbi:MAG: hypothetical protein HOP29_10950 [Phycisphaerales bacterium]|nr:hypothetical protein [Phycisphaerales bacterium]